MPQDKSPADALTEEFHQYLIKQYQANILKVSYAGAVFSGLILLILIIKSWLSSQIVNAFVMGLMLLLCVAFLVFPKLKLNTLETKNYTYHIGRITDKQVAGDLNGDRIRYLYVDGEKYSRFLLDHDYDFAAVGDRYIVIFFDNGSSICTRIQDIHMQIER